MWILCQCIKNRCGIFIFHNVEQIKRHFSEKNQVHIIESASHNVTFYYVLQSFMCARNLLSNILFQ